MTVQNNFLKCHSFHFVSGVWVGLGFNEVGIFAENVVDVVQKRGYLHFGRTEKTISENSAPELD